MSFSTFGNANAYTLTLSTSTVTTVLGANANRVYLTLINPSSSTGNMLIGFGFNPTTSVYSLLIPPGGSYEFPGKVFTGAIKALLDTGFATITATEGTP
jgi:hypothetical protein